MIRFSTRAPTSRRRLAFGVALALVGVVGLAHVSATPAAAWSCPPIPECTFSHLQVGGGPFELPTCCIYDCSWGLQEPVICFDT